MRLFLPALLGAVLFACSSDNPLAERVANLEQELSEVKAAQEEDRLNLLARLDALAVTEDNAEEIGAVRAKLNQTSITRSEFTRLANRVTALESKLRIGAGWLVLCGPPFGLCSSGALITKIGLRNGLHSSERALP